MRWFVRELFLFLVAPLMPIRIESNRFTTYEHCINV